MQVPCDSWPKLKIKKMKIACVLLGALMATCKLQAGPSVDWISDSSSSFDVVLTGTGPGWSGTVTSPSGLWQLSSADIIDYPASGQNSSEVFIDNSGVATYLGALSPQFPAPDPAAFAPFNTVSIGTYGGYQDYFNPLAPINDGNSLIYGYLAGLDWSGMSTITVTSMPSLNSTSGWDWSANYSACGGSLAAPEPSPISLAALAGVIIIASSFREKLKRDRTLSGAVKPSRL
jgi:hypothetical protein